MSENPSSSQDLAPQVNIPAPAAAEAPPARREKKPRSAAQLESLRRAREAKEAKRRTKTVVQSGRTAEEFASYAGESRESEGPRKKRRTESISTTALVVGGAAITAAGAALFLAQKKSQISGSASGSTTTTPPLKAVATAETPQTSSPAAGEFSFYSR